MHEYHSEAIVKSNGLLTIEGLPFKEGDRVDVVVRPHEVKTKASERYPLRGTPYRYDRPFDSVAENDWEVLK